MGLTGTVYRIVVVLHVMCAIIGFRRRVPELPAVKRMGVLMLGTLGRRVGATGAYLDVMVVVICCLMIWTPKWPDEQHARGAP